ncbi:MAG: SpoIIE family protein phosphatase [Syntrophorhabdaceae bacterium]|nr:SpoIIE family protein phosphatase [Syntrophorhabdaceae bacterium]
MLINKGIAFKLVLFFSSCTILIFSVIFLYSYIVSRKTIEKGISENSKNLVMTSINKIEAILAATQKIPENISYFLENSSNTEGEIYQVLYSVVEKNPEIYGAAIAYEPYMFTREKKAFAPYFYKERWGINFKYLEKYYDYFLSDWYQIPKEIGRPEWTEPYFGIGGNVLMCSYSVPFYKKMGDKRIHAGVVVVDISIEKLVEIVSSLKILNTGYGFLISKNGTFVTHPIKEYIMNETIFSIAEATEDRDLREVGRKMIKGGIGFEPFKIKNPVTGALCLMTYVPIVSNGWSLAIVFPQEELMEDITRLNKVIIFLGCLGIALLSVAIVYISRSITRPLRDMAHATERIGSGEFDIELPPIKSNDEVGRLTEAFEIMRKSLKTYITQLKETTAIKERVESELKVAHDIQMSFLPKEFPSYEERDAFDIYATLRPAKEVGGDLYDFFLIDRNRLCIVVGDVSGKGIPAALFMAMTKTLIKSKATLGFSPDKILDKVNNELSSGNSANMFVTLFCGILDLEGGRLEYSIGGHNPPYLIKSDGRIETLSGQVGLVVGIMEDACYGLERVELSPGDTLFLYTDGVNEAMNDKGEMFTLKRLEEELKGLTGKGVKEILSGLEEAVDGFCGEAEQSDDITMMVVRYYGRGESKAKKEEDGEWMTN